MNEIKRYDFHTGSLAIPIMESVTGEYIKASDLALHLDALKAAVEVLEAKLSRAQLMASDESTHINTRTGLHEVARKTERHIASINNLIEACKQ